MIENRTRTEREPNENRSRTEREPNEERSKSDRRAKRYVFTGWTAISFHCLNLLGVKNMGVLKFVCWRIISLTTAKV